MYKELKDAICNVGRILPNFKECIAPVLKVACDLQDVHGDINIKRNSYFEYGIWKSVVSVNSQTKQLHTENDCSYSVITVPKQNAMKKKRHYNFMYKLNGNECITLPMNDAMSFIFSGKFLIHRQFCNGDCLEKNDYFFNFQTYCNQKLFNHVKKSTNRIKNK